MPVAAVTFWETVSKLSIPLASNTTVPNGTTTPIVGPTVPTVKLAAFLNKSPPLVTLAAKVPVTPLFPTTLAPVNETEPPEVKSRLPVLITPVPAIPPEPAFSATNPLGSPFILEVIAVFTASAPAASSLIVAGGDAGGLAFTGCATVKSPVVVLTLTKPWFSPVTMPLVPPTVPIVSA